MRDELLRAMAVVGTWVVFFLGYWVLQRYALSALTLPKNISTTVVSLRTTAIDLPLIVLLVSGSSLCALRRTWAVGWLLYPVLLVVLGLNTANYLIAAEFGRSLTHFDLTYASDRVFLFGSALPALVSFEVILGLFVPLLLHIGTRHVLARRFRHLHATTVILISAVLCLPAFYIRRWGYRGKVHRTYAASQSLYFDSLLKGNLHDKRLTEAETEAFVRTRAKLFFGARKTAADSIPAASGERKNIVLVIMESFAYDMTIDTFDGQRIAPGMAAIAQRGLSFSRFYANSWRSSRALWSIYSGELDRIRGLLFLNNPQNAMPFMSDILRDKGYFNCWFHGNYASWDNRANILSRHGFEGIFGKEAFPDSCRSTGWGICDRDFFHHTFHKLDSIAARTQPFFATVLSISNHHPYEFPDSTGLFANPGNEVSISAINGHRYSDIALSHFYDSLRTRAWFNNTYLIVTADNGNLCGRPAATIGERIERLFHIPCIIQGPEMPFGAHDSTPGSQIDLAPTILHLAGERITRFGLGVSIFSRTGHALVPIVAPSRAATITPGGICTAAYGSTPASRSARTGCAARADLLLRYQSLWSRLIANGQERNVLRGAMGARSPALVIRPVGRASAQTNER